MSKELLAYFKLRTSYKNLIVINVYTQLVRVELLSTSEYSHIKGIDKSSMILRSLIKID